MMKYSIQRKPHIATKMFTMSNSNQLGDLFIFLWPFQNTQTQTVQIYNFITFNSIFLKSKFIKGLIVKGCLLHLIISRSTSILIE